ncbi:hypothetical protein BVZ64_01343B, partial [Haemophilus influenzae]
PTRSYGEYAVKNCWRTCAGR